MQNKKFPLSQGQQALWAIYQQDRQSSAYNHGILLEFKHKLDQSILRNTLFKVIDIHPILRTIIYEVDGKSYQKIAKPDLYLTWNDGSKNKDDISYDLQKPFKLECNNIHFYVYQSEKDTHLLIAQHHIMGDARSLAIIAQDIVNLYGAKVDKEHICLSTLDYNYNDYVNWEEKLLAGKKAQRARKYWNQQLTGDIPTLQLPTDFPRPAVQTFNGSSIEFQLSDSLRTQLNYLAKRYKVTLSVILLSVWQILLQRYSGQKDIWCGIPTSVPRSHPEFSNLVGYMVNPMIIRAKFPEQHRISFEQLMQKNSQQMLLGLFHQPYPFTHLVEQLQPKYNASYPTLIQVMFAMELNNLIPKVFKKNNYSAKRIDIDQMEGQFDLSLTLSETKKSLIGSLSYNSDLFKESTVLGIIRNFETLLSSAADNPKQITSRLAILHPQDIQKLKKWNNTRSEKSQHETIVGAFQSQVLKTPNNIALTYENKQWTYQELNRRSNQMANYLIKTKIENHISEGCLVAIVLERSLEMFTGLLATLKTGSAYMPIDPNYPLAHIHYMLKDSTAQLLLTHSSLRSSLSLSELTYDCTVVYLDLVDIK